MKEFKLIKTGYLKEDYYIYFAPYAYSVRDRGHYTKSEMEEFVAEIKHDFALTASAGSKVNCYSNGKDS